MSKVNDILNSAERLFDQQGFHSTGIDQIVKEASVTPRTLYRHFPSKEDLVLEVLEQREIRFLKQLEQKVHEYKCNTPLWILIVSELEKWFSLESSNGCLFLRALAEFSHKDAKIEQRVLLHKQRTLELFKKIFEKEFPDQFTEKAEILLFIIEGATALAPVIGGKAAIQRANSLGFQLLTPTTHPIFH